MSPKDQVNPAMVIRARRGWVHSFYNGGSGTFTSMETAENVFDGLAEDGFISDDGYRMYAEMADSDTSIWSDRGKDIIRELGIAEEHRSEFSRTIEEFKSRETSQQTVKRLIDGLEGDDDPPPPDTPLAA